LLRKPSEFPATIVSIFFLPFESAAPPATIGEGLTPPDNLLLGESEALLTIGEACVQPFEEGCLYLEGTVITSSLDAFRFTSRAATKLSEPHILMDRRC
jgi:hypothetical protein